MSGAAIALKTPRGFYPERPSPDEGGLDRALGTALGHLKRLRRLGPRRFHDIVGWVERAGGDLAGLSRDELTWKVAPLRADLRMRGFTPELAGRAFALVREISSREIGERPYDVQLIGGYALLEGMVAEMATGEGKTLAATLPACTAALAGVPVHVITVNDYLTRRDAAWMGPIYRALGLTVGAVTHEMTAEERRAAYRCDVTYCTNKEVAFDYLRDRLDLGGKPGQIRLRLERLQGEAARLDRLRLRGLCFGIVDEADSVLVDEARTPLIISGRGDVSHELELYRQALAASERLVAEEDYRIDFPKRDVVLTARGIERLSEFADRMGGFWTGRLRREDIVRKALTARLLFHRDKQYVVKENQISIVDEYTGRIMPGRSWEGGLHQLIETKEGVDVTTRTEVLARISYQRFFRRYLALAGMTGTASEAARELWAVYRLEVCRIPTHRPMIRRGLRSRCTRTAERKWEAVAHRITELHAGGRPVLVGTRTVADSEHLARHLEAVGLPARVLNAVMDREEAEIISRAGGRGQVTVATNMAGRGTDIKLEPGVAALGGLHVIATERHDAGRIDRQLFGRCGRQGDPGSFEVIASLEDDLLRAHLPERIVDLAGRFLDPATPAGRFVALALFRIAQRAAERRHYRARRELLRMDEQLENALAFSGKGE